MLNRLKADQLQARKNRDTVKAALLSTLIGDIEKISKDASNNSVDDGRIVKVTQKFITNAKEVMSLSPEGSAGRMKAAAEIAILEDYVPKAIDEATVELAVLRIKTTLGPSANMGSVMKALKEEFGAALDGKMASAVVKKAL